MRKSAALAKPLQREKPALRLDPYFLRDLHHEIDFYDRKLAYLDQFGEFPTPSERQEAEKVLRAKRALLERSALELAASGVAFDEKDLPRSFRVMNLEQDGPEKNIALVKRSKKAAPAQASAGS